MNHNTRVPEPWDGYENYPTCSSRSDAYRFDFETYRQQLKEQSSWIFANEEADISVRVLHNNGDGGDAVVKTRQDLEAQICVSDPKLN